MNETKPASITCEKLQPEWFNILCAFPEDQRLNVLLLVMGPIYGVVLGGGIILLTVFYKSKMAKLQVTYITKEAKVKAGLVTKAKENIAKNKTKSRPKKSVKKKPNDRDRDQEKK